MNNFLEEILEQPKALKDTLEFYSNGKGQDILKEITQVFNNRKFEKIIFTGMGSSYFTSFAASNLFNDYNLEAYTFNSSELLHYNLSVLTNKTLLICFSQSGESFEIKKLLRILPLEVFCIGVTNEAESTLAKKSDIALLSKAGKEEMTSTKTYVSILLLAYILGWSLTGNWNTNKINTIENLIKGVSKILYDYEAWINEVLQFLGDISFIQLIARGPSYSSAMQGALMFKEATRTPAEGIFGGEFRHGPMEMVQKGFKAILFAPKGKTNKQSLQMAEDILEFGGKVLLITNSNQQFTNPNIKILSLDEPDEYLFSILSIIPVQLLVDSFGKSKGLVAGSFSRGAKVTIKE